MILLKLPTAAVWHRTCSVAALDFLVLPHVFTGFRLMDWLGVYIDQYNIEEV